MIWTEKKQRHTLSSLFFFLLKALNWQHIHQAVHWKLVVCQTDNGAQWSPQQPARLSERVHPWWLLLLCPRDPRALSLRVFHPPWPPAGCSPLKYPFLFPPVTSLKSQTWSPSSPNPKPSGPRTHSHSPELSTSTSQQLTFTGQPQPWHSVWKAALHTQYLPPKCWWSWARRHGFTSFAHSLLFTILLLHWRANFLSPESLS